MVQNLGRKLEETPQAIIIEDSKELMDILEGKRFTSVKRGYINYREGATLIGSPKYGPCALVDIWKVEYEDYGQLIKSGFENYGYISEEDMGKKIFEGGEKPFIEAPLTIIKWKNLRGVYSDSLTPVSKILK